MIRSAWNLSSGDLLGWSQIHFHDVQIFQLASIELPNRRNAGFGLVLGVNLAIRMDILHVTALSPERRNARNPNVSGTHTGVGWRIAAISNCCALRELGPVS